MPEAGKARQAARTPTGRAKGTSKKKSLSVLLCCRRQSSWRLYSKFAFTPFWAGTSSRGAAVQKSMQTANPEHLPWGTAMAMKYIELGDEYQLHDSSRLLYSNRVQLVELPVPKITKRAIILCFHTNLSPIMSNITVPKLSTILPY